MQTTFAVAGLAMCLAACGCESMSDGEETGPNSNPHGDPAHGDPKPVSIEAPRLTDSAATLRFAFPWGARNVTLEVYGLDGLTVSSASALEKREFAAGEKAEIEVSFRKGPAESRLVALVRGEFRGRPESRAVSFAIGTPSAEQLRDRSKGVEVDAQGRRIRVTPAKRG